LNVPFKVEVHVFFQKKVAQGKQDQALGRRKNIKNICQHGFGNHYS
jgi:hypothetical protein